MARAATKAKTDSATKTAKSSKPNVLPINELLASNKDLQKLLISAKDSGELSLDALNKALPADVSPEQIDDLIAALEGRGIGIHKADPAQANTPADTSEDKAAGDGDQADNADNAESSEGDDEAEGTVKIQEADLGRTDDPVRMYLREMGTIELLSREGEIEIAKRIEAGRNMVLEALCESPLTMRAVIGWRDAIRDGRVLLRDIIDLDATNSAEAAAAEEAGIAAAEKMADESKSALEGEGSVITATPDAPDDDSENAAGEDREKPEGETTSTTEDDFDEEALSLSAMEDKLRDGVLETFDSIANAYAKLRDIQDERLGLIQNAESVDKNLDRRYHRARGKMVELMTQVQLNNSRVEALVEQLFDMNKLLMSLEGKLLRLATQNRVSREGFLKHYFGHELDPDWIDRVGALKDRGWGEFVERSREDIEDLRSDISAIAEETGLQIAEFRRIVAKVQKASAMPARPKRKWSRPICGWSYPSPRNTPIAVCNSSISSRKAISA